MNFKMFFHGAAFTLFLSGWAPFPGAAQPASAGGAAMSVVSLDADSRTWQGPPGQQVIEIATGMNYFDKSSQQWLRSDPSFVPSPDGSSFVAAKLPNQVTLSADLNTVAAVTDVTPDGLTLQSTPVAIGLYDAASGKSMIIASLTNSQGVLVDARHVLYPGAMVGGLLQADVVTSGVPDCGCVPSGCRHHQIQWAGLIRRSGGCQPAPRIHCACRSLTEFYGDVPVPSEIIEFFENLQRKFPEYLSRVKGSIVSVCRSGG